MSDFNQYTAAPEAPTAVPGAEERQWAMFAHLSALVGLIIPFGNLLGPLVVWLVKRDTMPFVADQGKEALNFQITVTVVCVVLGIAAFILSFVLIGFLLFPVIALVGLAALVLAIIAGIKANEGTAYRYPFSVRLIK
ncbi:DUF4870 domain-containing protein [Pseudoxanthomonas mexicana]|uniref:DUF4870 domain-containing protein n=1 Tax=Pseudoxanthomonas mexicana TaxID=128785 RepID=UPI00398AD3A3